MQFLNYSAASLVSFCGLIIGMVLVRIAPEEQRPLGKYLEPLRKILFFLIFSLIIFYYHRSPYYITILSAYLGFLAFVEFRMQDKMKKSMIVYTALGILFFLSSRNTNLFLIESSMITLYVMPTASLVYSKKERNHFKIIALNLGFVIICTLLFLLSK